MRASVSNLELFRMWRGNHDLDLEWLLRRLRGEEPQTEAMKAGEAFHKILENPNFDELNELTYGDYWFSMRCDVQLVLPTARELSIEKQYGDLLVRGRVDGISGTTVTDYKTTAQFDADRLMDGYQWRFYLDMLNCDTFTWQVFVLSPTDYHDKDYDLTDKACALHYYVTQSHSLTQKRYLGMHGDCARIAHDYLEFARVHADRIVKVAA